MRIAYLLFITIIIFFSISIYNKTVAAKDLGEDPPIENLEDLDNIYNLKLYR